jgi:translation initiation factor 3 subunit L
LHIAFFPAHRHASSVCRYFNRQSPGDQINKWNDKMLALLAAVVVLCPGQRLDDSVNTILRDKYADKIARMQRG